MEEVEIPHSTSSGQALRQAQGRLWITGDAGMTGVCSVGRADVSSFRADVSSFWPNVFSFKGNVSTLAADVSSFRRGAWVGAGVAVGAGAVAGRDGGGAEVLVESGRMGGPRITVNSRCQALIREFGSYRYHEPREHHPISEAPIDAGQSRHQGVVLLAVRPVWGGASTGAAAVDSVADYVVRRLRYCTGPSKGTHMPVASRFHRHQSLSVPATRRAAPMGARSGGLNAVRAEDP